MCKLKKIALIFTVLPVFGFAVAFDCNASVIEDGDGQTFLIYGGHQYFIEKMNHLSQCPCKFHEWE